MINSILFFTIILLIIILQYNKDNFTQCQGVSINSVQNSPEINNLNLGASTTDTALCNNAPQTSIYPGLNCPPQICPKIVLNTDNFQRTSNSNNNNNCNISVLNAPSNVDDFILLLEEMLISGVCNKFELITKINRKLREHS